MKTFGLFSSSMKHTSTLALCWTLLSSSVMPLPAQAARSSSATSSAPASAAADTAAKSERIRRVSNARAITGGPIDEELRARPITSGGDRSLSPFFFVEGGDSSVDALPLKATSADVDVVGVMADVLVTQVYKNEGKRPLEARYVFPASTRAAVYGMQMTIGERTITAQIQEKAQARATYEAAKAEGRSASLLEQQRPNVFEMNVANIMPGDEIKVEMRYTELLIPTDGIYEFVYPTVVGPRYSNQMAGEAPAQDQFVANPYTPAGVKPSYAFDFTATLSTGIPIQGIASPSHNMRVQYEGERMATVVLDQADQGRGNKDVVLRYRLSGGRIETGVLLFEGKNKAGEDDNYFLVMAQPPRVVKPEFIPPREYIFIVDISGSMSGFPLETSKALLRDLIGKLKPSEKFNVLLFAGSTSVMSPASVPATPENIQRAIALIQNPTGGGGTELLPALNRAFDLPRSEGYARSIVVATDGYVNVERQAFRLIRERLGDANFFSFGIGSSVNRYLLEGMAKVGMGETGIILDGNKAAEEAARFRQYIEAPVLTQVRLKSEQFQPLDLEPRAIPDVLAQRPVLVYGRYKGKAQGKLILEGMSGEGPYRQVFDLNRVPARVEHGALRYLWARNRIATLKDYGDLEPGVQVEKEVTRLGLSYNLLTDYTSFVAVDTQVRNRGGEQETVQQPLPLPEGVSNAAVSGELQRKKPATSLGYQAPAAPPAAAPVMARAPSAQRAEAVTISSVHAGRAVVPQPGPSGAALYDASTQTLSVMGKGAVTGTASASAQPAKKPASKDARRDTSSAPQEERKAEAGELADDKAKDRAPKTEAPALKVAVLGSAVLKGQLSTETHARLQQQALLKVEALLKQSGVKSTIGYALTLKDDGSIEKVELLTDHAGAAFSADLKLKIEAALKGLRLPAEQASAGDLVTLIFQTR
ncbi:MAG: VIT and vWA domain-containing protein [Myxococcota bacterium]